MPSAFQVKLDRLAQLLVYSAGVYGGAEVLLHVHYGGEDLAALVAKHCYTAGASRVERVSFDQRVLAEHLRSGANPRIFSRAEWYAWERVRKKHGCFIQIRADPNPELFDGISDIYGQWYRDHWRARGQFVKRGIVEGELPWTLFYVPTLHTAKRTFPELPENQALGAYWEAVFRITQTDKPNFRELAKENEVTLARRCEILDGLNIAYLEFSGPGTHLNVPLHPRARWLGGGKEVTSGGYWHVPNVPTYEVFTTPYWPGVEGVVRVTKDTVLEGALIRALNLVLEKGRVVGCKAMDIGGHFLHAFIRRDVGASRLGEVALVGLDSPVQQENRVFYSMILDENAACHFALGSAYRAAMKNASEITTTDYEHLGFNSSGVHHDFMISDENTEVVAVTRDRRRVVLLEGGYWTPDFL